MCDDCATCDECGNEYDVSEYIAHMRNHTEESTVIDDTRPNGHVSWETTVTEEYDCVFSPEQMEELGFAFIDGRWSTDGDNGYRVTDTLAESEGDGGSLVLCERTVTTLANTDSPPDSED